MSKGEREISFSLAFQVHFYLLNGRVYNSFNLPNRSRFKKKQLWNLPDNCCPAAASALTGEAPKLAIQFYLRRCLTRK